MNNSNVDFKHNRKAITLAFLFAMKARVGVREDVDSSWDVIRMRMSPLSAWNDATRENVAEGNACGRESIFSIIEHGSGSKSRKSTKSLVHRLVVHRPRHGWLLISPAIS